jgi:hypothetical protein
MQQISGKHDMMAEVGWMASQDEGIANGNRKETVMILGNNHIMLRALQYTVARTMAWRDHVMSTMKRPR